MKKDKEWEILSPEENSSIWRDIEIRFRFDPKSKEFLTRSAGFSCYDISNIYIGQRTYRTGDEGIIWRTARYRDLEDDLNTKIIYSLRENIRNDSFVYALNWQHDGYRMFPHNFTKYKEADNWIVPIIPNGDFYVFISADFDFGLFGHPWINTICLFGDNFVNSIKAQKPLLLSRSI